MIFAIAPLVGAVWWNITTAIAATAIVFGFSALKKRLTSSRNQSSDSTTNKE